MTRLKATQSEPNGAPARDVPAAARPHPSAPPQSRRIPPSTATSSTARRPIPQPDQNKSGSRAASAPSRPTGYAQNAEDRRNTAHGKPKAGAPTGFGGDGLFVVGLDITPGVYRTAGPISGRRGYFALLKSTSTRDILENSIVAGAATITVGPGVKAVQVRRCQPWYRLGDSLDEVIAAAGEPRRTEGPDSPRAWRGPAARPSCA
jgi:hypothetical protein